MDSAEQTGPPLVPGYAVTRLVGKGAASEVWAALDEATGQPVAVKVADPTACLPGQMRHLAAREAAVLDRVPSEHLVRLRSTVTLPTGAVALVLDLAEGGSLASLVAARGRLGDGEVVTICTALATTLAGLHEAGVVHGDLTAGNVLFTGDGKPLLADFTSARLVGESDPPLVAGTAGFVAPEVARGDIPTEESDAYGLGALAWFALTGRPRAAGAEPDLAEAVGFLGRRLGPVVAPLLADDPAQRPALADTAVAFYGAAIAVPVTLVDGAADPAAALTRRIRASAAEGSTARSSPRAVRESVPAGWWRSLRPHATPRRLPVVLASLAVAALALVAGARVLGPGEPGPGGLRSAAGAGVGLSSDPAGTREPASTLPPASPPDSTGAGLGPADTTDDGSTPADTTGEASSPADLVRADPRAVLATLADARATALTSAEPGQLLAAAAPDSPVHQADAALLATIGASSSRYADLTFTVSSAEVLDGTATETRVRAVVDRSAYRVVGPGSQERSVPAQPGEAYVYRLVLVENQWRLSDIT